MQIKPIAINSFFSFLSSLGGKVSHTILLSRPGHIPSCYYCLTLCCHLSISVSTGQLFFYFSFPMGTICILQKSCKHGHFRIVGTKKSRIFFISAFNRSYWIFYIQNIKSAVLSGMWALPTLQVTVMETIPFTLPWRVFMKRQALRGIRTLPSRTVAS